MADIYRDVPIGTVNCPGCGQAVPAGSEVCAHCRAPLDPARFGELELKLRPALRSASRALGLVTGLHIVGLLVLVASDSDRAALLGGATSHRIRPFRVRQGHRSAYRHSASVAVSMHMVVPSFLAQSTACGSPSSEQWTRNAP